MEQNQIDQVPLAFGYNDADQGDARRFRPVGTRIQSMTKDETNPAPPLAEAIDDNSLDAEWRRILAESGLIEGSTLPPRVVGSPSAMKFLPQEKIHWWKPGWSDMRKHVGWRWVFLFPAPLLLINLFVPLPVLGPILLAQIHFFIFMIAVGVTLAGYALRRAAHARREPFCIFCGYNLTGLPDHYRCPECGRPYTWRLIAEYRRDPSWFIERYNALKRLPPADTPFESGQVRSKRRDDGT